MMCDIPFVIDVLDFWIAYAKPVSMDGPMTLEHP